MALRYKNVSRNHWKEGKRCYAPAVRDYGTTCGEIVAIIRVVLRQAMWYAYDDD